VDPSAFEAVVRVFLEMRLTFHLDLEINGIVHRLETDWGYESDFDAYSKESFNVFRRITANIFESVKERRIEDVISGTGSLFNWL
jgi:hypothetical protein